jgi:hypothetical protein
MPFDEVGYTNNRFYSPKMCVYRKQISYESAMGDIKRNVQKHWKMQKDLLDLETSITSVQSLALTAQYNAQLRQTHKMLSGETKDGGLRL